MTDSVLPNLSADERVELTRVHEWLRLNGLTRDEQLWVTVRETLRAAPWLVSRITDTGPAIYWPVPRISSTPLQDALSAKDEAYAERNRLVASLSKLFPASLERHPETEEWDDDWRWVVFIEIPTIYPIVYGDARAELPKSMTHHYAVEQVSWHIHDSELPLFSHLERNAGRVWDGHTTEEKYGRLAAIYRKAFR